MNRSTAETSVEIPKHAAYDEAARQLGLPDTAFGLDHEENVLHYRYLASEVYKLRNFLTWKFGQFEGPTIPHVIELIKILYKMEPEPPKLKPEDPEILKARVKHYLKESFSQPILMDMIVCLDDLGTRFGVSRDLSSQYLIEAINKDRFVRQIGNFVYGKGKEPILEAAVKSGRVTKTRLVEDLARLFGVGQETMIDELNDAISRNSSEFTISHNRSEIAVTLVPEKRRKTRKK